MVMKDRFTMLVTYKKTDGSVSYQPVQAKQFCYKDSTSNIQCRLVDAQHAPPADVGQGYGGVGGIGSKTCKASLASKGIDCTSPTFNGPAIKLQAFQTCSDSGDTLLTPHDQVQNEIIKAMMIDEVRLEILILYSMINFFRSFHKRLHSKIQFQHKNNYVYESKEFDVVS